MTAIETYLSELQAALHVRGRPRRRLIAECREHLADASSLHGEEEAVRRFGPAAPLARSFDAEVAVRRGLSATLFSAGGVLAAGFSSLAMIHGAQPQASASPVWAVTFFGAAQTSGVCLFLAALQAVAMWRGWDETPAQVALLCRRNLVALAFAAVTLFSVGAALPGQTSAWKVVIGPAVALLAAAGVVRARRLARALEAAPRGAVRAPLADLLAALRLPRLGGRWIRSSSSTLLLAGITPMAAAAAFVWDNLEQGTISTSTRAAAIEAALTVAGFVLLGPALGLRASHARRRHPGAA